MAIDYQVSFEYYCVMLHKPIYNFASPISLPCWLGGRLVVAYALAVAIMILAVSIASPSESDAFANAALAGCWQMLLALLVGAAVFGFSCAVVEATTMRVLFAAPCQPPWGAYARDMVSRIAALICAFTTNCLILFLLIGVARATQRPQTYQPRLPCFTPDCWLTGTPPRLTYEAA